MYEEQSAYGNLTPEQMAELNALLSRTTIKSNGTIDGQYNPAIANLQGGQQQFPPGMPPAMPPEMQQQMPPDMPPAMPQNFIRNENTGSVTGLSNPQNSRDPWVTGPQEISRFQMPDGRIRIREKVPAMRDGRQSTGYQERYEIPEYLDPLKRKELEYRELSNKVNAKNESSYDKELGKRLAEADVMKLMAKTPGTPEYERVKKEARAADAEKSKTRSATESAMSTYDAILNAEKKVGFWGTGLTGQVLSNIGGTDARNLDKALEPIRANLAFDRLQRMRNESVTGGALGQVAVREIELLMDSMSSLDQAQGEGELKYSLDKVKNHYTKYLNAMSEAVKSGEFQNPPPEFAKFMEKVPKVDMRSSTQPKVPGRTPIPVRSESEAMRLPKGSVVTINGRTAVVE
jgi:hypothetical protein